MLTLSVKGRVDRLRSLLATALIQGILFAASFAVGLEKGGWFGVLVAWMVLSLSLITAFAVLKYLSGEGFPSVVIKDAVAKER